MLSGGDISLARPVSAENSVGPAELAQLFWHSLDAAGFLRRPCKYIIMIKSPIPLRVGSSDCTTEVHWGLAKKTVSAIVFKSGETWVVTLQ